MQNTKSSTTSLPAHKASDRIMAVARSEAVQPSLWDRLLNDLPGLLADIASLREQLEEVLNEDIDIDAMIEDGLTSLRQRSDLDEDAYQLCSALIMKSEEKSRIENRGVVVTQDVLREAVRRDIEMLFNIERLEADYILTEAEEQRIVTPDDMLEGFPEVRRSVVNFGVPSFSGRKGTDFDKDELARELKEVLQNFEPRLKPDSIKVQVGFAEKVGMRVDVDAILLLSPVPERLRLSTTIDMESGRASTTQEEV